MAQWPQEITSGTRVRKRRRAPPGGRAAPARTVRPWGGRPVPSLCKLIHKVLPYATTDVFFAITSGVSATVTPCSVSYANYNICRRV